MSVAAEKARGLRAAQLAKRREVERADALNFQFGFGVLLVGEVQDSDGNVVTLGRAIHDPETCVHVRACTHDAGCQREACRPCSRTYDPTPYPEAAPSPPRMYAGTGVGALYGLPGSERHLWQLAGWQVAIPAGGDDDAD